MRKRTLAVFFALAGSPGLAGSAEPSVRKETPSFPVGSVPADELGKDLDGNAITVSSYHGKVVIVSFWASWCAPCMQELPVLAGVVKQVGQDHLQVIAINYRDEYQSFKHVVNVLKDYPIIFMRRDPNDRAAKKFGVRGIPRMIIIGRDGKVAADHIGYGEGVIPELVDELNALLARGA